MKTKSRKKIYFFLNYSPEEIFGGQIRSCAMIKFYASLGFDVNGCYIDTSNSESKQNIDESKNFFKIHRSLKDYIGWHGGQHLANDFMLNNPSNYEQLINNIKSVNPDIFVFEEPWLFALQNIPSFKALLNGKKIIYDSHNLEHVMLQNINPDAKLVEATKNLEIELCKSADLLIATSKGEYNFFTLHKQQRANLVLIPNCSNLYLPNTSSKSIKDIFKDNIIFSFISSAHTPNVLSAKELFCFMPLFLDENSKIAICGGISRHILQFVQKLPTAELWLEKLLFVPKLTRDEIMWVYNLSHAIILPILYGDGTNIKTAEALLSNKYVIGTNKAFRGYEAFTNHNGVISVESMQSLRDEMYKFSYSKSKNYLQSYNRNLEEHLTWNSLLQKSLKDYLLKLD